MGQKIFAFSFAIFAFPIAFALLILALIVMHHELYSFGPALILIAIAMGLSGLSSIKHATRHKVTPFALWLGKRYRQALLAKDFKHARRWNALCRKNAARTAYTPTIVPAAVFFIVGTAFVVPSVFVLTFYW